MAGIIQSDIPLLVGKVSNFGDAHFALTGHLGDTRSLTQEEYQIIKHMDGFHTFKQLSESLQTDINNVHRVYNQFNGIKTLTNLSSWNQVGWCDHCGVYVGGDSCSVCSNPTKRIVFSPPCDPFICFEEERYFIVKVLREQYGVNISDNSLLLVNNGVESNVFFWEVVYNGAIILKITFPTFYEKDWIYNLISKPETDRESLLDENSLQSMLEANRKRQQQLFDESSAFLLETTQIYDTKPLIYFSGGKESQVMLSLFQRLNISANVITVVTGVEFPDDITFIKNYKQRIEKDNLFDYYYYEDDGKKIIETLNEKKILSAKDPWCRLDFKRKLKNKGTEDIYKGTDFVACEGSRWYENDFRRRHTKINFISDYMHQVWIHPIAEWTSLDVWLYIFQNDIPVNPVYHKGFQRTTCWLCPIVTPFHMRSSIKYYPELWQCIKGCKMEAFGDDKSRNLPF